MSEGELNSNIYCDSDLTVNASATKATSSLEECLGLCDSMSTSSPERTATTSVPSTTRQGWPARRPAREEKLARRIKKIFFK